jgi:hypothetical protein
VSLRWCVYHSETKRNVWKARYKLKLEARNHCGYLYSDSWLSVSALWVSFILILGPLGSMIKIFLWYASTYTIVWYFLQLFNQPILLLFWWPYLSRGEACVSRIEATLLSWPLTISSARWSHSSLSCLRTGLGWPQKF